MFCGKGTKCFFSDPIHQAGDNFEPFPKQQILYSSKLKEFAVDNFKFDENSRKFSKWVENTVGKEIARYEQFLLFQQCFQKTSTAGSFGKGLHNP